MTQAFIHNIHPSFADEQKRRAVMASLGSKPFNDDAAFERLTKEVKRIKSAIAPERIQSEVEKALRPLRAEAALMEKEQIANAHYAAFDDFSDVDLNAMMEE
ncbi:hypothetical protein [Parasphingorhabdus sp.]|uniref:hypothetical protein n=1 Tax=Parasphingorhabdus sp. TaxID=2709688 RepID=UPI0032F024C5